MQVLVRAPITLKDMHRTTAILAQAAGDVGDEFLKYLYVMALMHIEEETNVPTLPHSQSNAIRTVRRR